MAPQFRLAAGVRPGDERGEGLGPPGPGLGFELSHHASEHGVQVAGRLVLRERLEQSAVGLVEQPAQREA